MKVLDFIYNIFPWWIWVLHSFPLIFWISTGFNKDALDGLPKALGWWASLSLAYLLYYVNFVK